MKSFAVCIVIALIASVPLSAQGAASGASSKKPVAVYGLENTRAPRTPAPVAAPAQKLPPLPAPDMLSGNIGDIARHARELNLTDEQMQSFSQIQSDFQKEALRMNESARGMRQAISDSLKKINPDFASAKEKVQAISDMQNSIRMALFETYEKAYAVLTPEQKASYQKLLSSVKRQAKPAASAAKTAPQRSVPAQSIPNDGLSAPAPNAAPAVSPSATKDEEK